MGVENESDELALFVKRIDESGLFKFFDEAQLDKIGRTRVMSSLAQRIHDRLDAFQRRKLIA